MIEKKQFEKVTDALSGRSKWEERQRVWYRMRHTGLARRNPPWPGAADMHFPLIDTIVDKLKPFYFNQAFQTDRLAQFVALKDQATESTTNAAEAFDYHLKQETDFEAEVMGLIDLMLETGRSVMKVGWDSQRKRLTFQALHPLHVIVPSGARQLDQADWFVEVAHLSREEYLRDERFTVRDDESLKLICGPREDGNTYLTEKAAREGLTHSTDSDTIVVWYHHVRTRAGWECHTYAAKKWDLELRKPFTLPYKWQDQPILNYVAVHMERTDAGWYSSRGVAERLAPFQSALCKQWNEKLDWMTLLNRPYWRDTQGKLGNTANFRARPGELLPYGVEPAPAPGLPNSFDQEMYQTRAVAEQVIMMPDFGSGSQIGQGSDKKTATEVQAIMSMSSQGVDLRGRVFRKALGEIYRVAWSILLQFNTTELVWWTGEQQTQRRSVGKEVLHDLYRIQPDGSPDQWHRQARYQRALQRFQLFRGDPNIHQGELKKSVLQEDDPRLVRQLFLEDGTQTAREEEDEASEIVLMLHGYPCVALPHEDHAARLRVLVDKLASMAERNEPPDMRFAQLMQQHIAAHQELLAKTDPAAAKQVQAELQAMITGQPAGNPMMPRGPMPAAGPQPMPGGPGPQLMPEVAAL